MRPFGCAFCSTAVGAKGESAFLLRRIPSCRFVRDRVSVPIRQGPDSASGFAGYNGLAFCLRLL